MCRVVMWYKLTGGMSNVIVRMQVPGLSVSELCEWKIFVYE